MEFRKTREIITNATIYYIRIEDFELQFAPLDEFDMRLIRECDKSIAVADKLLALEAIVRKIEIANKVPQP